MPVLCVQSNLAKTNFRGPTNLGLIIRSSYQDIILHVQYYSKPNRAWKLVCVKQKFVLRVFFLMRFYCTTHRYYMHYYTQVLYALLHTGIVCITTHRYYMHYYTQVLYALLHTGIVCITTHRYYMHYYTQVLYTLLHTQYLWHY